MADKAFTKKVGYQDALDFDPINGVLKYGSYEAFAEELGIKKSTAKYDLDSFIKNRMRSGTGAQALTAITDDLRNRYRPQFEAMMEVFRSGKPDFTPGATYDRKTNTNSAFNPGKPQAPIVESIRAGAVETARSKFSPAYGVRSLGADSYEVNSYQIPSDSGAGYELINTINNRAAQLGRVSRTNDALKQNQQDAANRRQGRAATVINS